MMRPVRSLLTSGVAAAGLLALAAPLAFVSPAVGAESNPEPPPQGTSDVSDLDFLSETNGWGPVERDQTVGGEDRDDGGPLTLDGTVYPKGLGTNSVSKVEIYLGGQCTSFTSLVGIDDDAEGRGSVTFTVLADGVEVAGTDVIQGSDHLPPQTLEASVEGAQTLTLVVGDGGDVNAYDHGDWAQPQLTCTGVAPTIASIAPVDGISVPLGADSDDIIAALPSTTAITDNFDKERDADLHWVVDEMDTSHPGQGTVTATFDLPYGLQQDDPEIPLTVSASVTVAPGTVVVTFDSGAVSSGDELVAHGEGFQPGEHVVATLAGDEVGAATASGDGSVDVTFSAPTGLLGGLHSVELRGEQSSWHGSGAFRVKKAEVSVSTPTLSTRSQLAGTQVRANRARLSTQVTGVDSGLVTFMEGSTVVGTAPVAEGQAVVWLPADLAVGEHRFTARVAPTGLTKAAVSPESAVFTVEKAALKKLKVKATKKVRKKGYRPHHKVKVKVKVSKKLTNGAVAKGKVKLRVKQHGSFTTVKKKNTKKFRNHGGKLKLKIAKRYVHGEKVKVKAVYKPKHPDVVKKAKKKLVLHRR